MASAHKMGMAISQSSVFHLQGDRIDPVVLKQREDLLGTTSSLSLVYLSLDGWRRQMVEHGRELLDAALALSARAREEIDAIEGLSLMGREVVRPAAAFDLDPLTLTVDVRRSASPVSRPATGCAPSAASTSRPPTHAASVRA